MSGAFPECFYTHVFTDDVDIATSWSPKEVCHILDVGGIPYDKTLLNLGVVKAGNVDITSFRKEVYKDRTRTPKVILDVTMKEDYLRRDFTVNGFYMDMDFRLLEHDLFVPPDEVFGKKMIETIKPPEISYYEDPLRIFRAVRFAHKLRYSISDKDLDIMEKLYPRAIELCRESLIVKETSNTPLGIYDYYMMGGFA